MATVIVLALLVLIIISAFFYFKVEWEWCFWPFVLSVIAFVFLSIVLFSYIGDFSQAKKDSLSIDWYKAENVKIVKELDEIVQVYEEKSGNRHADNGLPYDSTVVVLLYPDLYKTGRVNKLLEEYNFNLDRVCKLEPSLIMLSHMTWELYFGK